MMTSVYNHLLTSYVDCTDSKKLKNVHKRSELRSIYNAIIKMNKTSPLYKVDLTKETQTFALGIKDTSLQLSETAKTLYSDQKQSIFNTLQVYSEDETSAFAHFTKDNLSNLPDAFSLKINTLATKQENISFCVPMHTMSPAPGNYSFNISYDDTSYSFRYTVNPTSNNEDTLTKLSNFINKSKIGLYCSIQKKEDNTIQLTLLSNDTGSTGEPIFTLEDTLSPDGEFGLIEYYGLNQVTNPAQNAVFEINGAKKESLSNQILLNQVLQVDFLSSSKDSFQIAYLPDSEKILSRMKQFQSLYNNIIDLANTYPSKYKTSQKLLYKLRKLNAPYQNDLESCGISFSEEGKMQIDTFLSIQSIESKELNSLFSSTGYLNVINKQISSIILNPMEYVDKTIITYPNFIKPSPSQPYISSIYSGLIYNYYC